MAPLTICSRPECQTTAGCRCASTTIPAAWPSHRDGLAYFVERIGRERRLQNRPLSTDELGRLIRALPAPPDDLDPPK